MSLEEATISNGGIAALVEELETDDLCMKHDLFDMITQLDT
jgi:hypothetical protein